MTAMKQIGLVLAIGLVVAIAGGAPALAQDGIRTEPVRFAPGTTGTTIRGTIQGRESVSYKLGAEAGQRMRVTLRSNNTATYFNVYEPGRGPGDQALAVGEITGPTVPEINRFDGVLTTSGTYTISVYLYRNAARRGERSDFTLDIAITGETGAVLQGDYADGLQGGPDYWRVRAGDGLNLRVEPTTRARALMRLPNGLEVRNLGCRMREGRRWCRVATPEPSVEGWVAGDFLVEGSDQTATQLPDMAPVGSAGATSTPAEQACLAAVSRETNNGDVVLLGSELSQAGTLVRVGVGESRAPWKCIAYSDGSTGGVEYLDTDG